MKTQQQFKIVLADVLPFKGAINLIKELSTESIIKIDENQLQILFMDSSNVAKVNYRIYSSFCTEWDVKSESLFCINLSNFNTILKAR